MLLSTAAVLIVSLALVACEGSSKSDSAPSPVPSATLPAVLPTVQILTPVSSETADPCPRTGVNGTKTLASGDQWVINCGTSTGLIIAGILSATDLSGYRQTKAEVDRTLCRMWSQDFIDRRVSWAPPTPSDLTFTPDDVHTVCIDGK